MATVPIPAWLARVKNNEVLQLVAEAGAEWSKDKVYQLGAALAYYAVFAIAPVLVIAVAVVSLVLGEKAARGELLETIEGTVGTQIGGAIEQLLSYSSQTGGGLWATILSTALLLVAATGLFGQIQEALNSIWDVKVKPGRGIWGTIKDRVWSFTAILCIGLLVLLAVGINAGVTTLGKFLNPSTIPGGLHLWQALNLALSLIYLTVLFAVLYKILPDAHIAWQDVWTGAMVTAFLFMLGNHLIGLYLRYTNVATTYGAPGSVVIVLLWVYYSAQIFLFGAELTHIHAQRQGKALIPKANAERCDAPSAHKAEGEKKKCEDGRLAASRREALSSRFPRGIG